MFFFGCHILASNGCVHTVLSIKDRIAQSVERWSNKPLVRGSSPLVITSFVRLSGRVLDVAFVAERLRRYVQVVVLFEGVGSSPTECNIFFLDVVFWLISCPYHVRLIRITTQPDSNQNTTRNNRRKQLNSGGRPTGEQKGMAVPGFEPGSSGSQPLMLTTTLYHHGTVLYMCRSVLKEVEVSH
jgi:hypothetical protein